MYNPTTEDQYFKLKTNKTNKKCIPDKKQKRPYCKKVHIEATNNALETEEQNNNRNK